MTPNPFDPLDGVVADTLDLHGVTAAQARAMVTGYVERSRKRRPGELVHIITGKGRNSNGQPVLLPLVRGLLRAAPQTQVATWGPDDDEGGFLIRLAGGRVR